MVPSHITPSSHSHSTHLLFCTYLEQCAPARKRGAKRGKPIPAKPRRQGPAQRREEPLLTLALPFIALGIRPLLPPTFGGAPFRGNIPG